MGNLLLLLLLIAPVAVMIAVRRNRREQRSISSATVELDVDEFGVSRELADGRQERIEWNEVNEVEVWRTRRGPHAGAGGLVILWGDETRGCLVPLDRAEPVLEVLPRLPGLSGVALANALAAGPETRTVVWRRDS
jgi:hypothetical protein